MDNDTAAKEKDRLEKDLLDPGHNAGADWFTKLATVERAKALRREAQKAREGNPITFSKPGDWPRAG